MDNLKRMKQTTIIWVKQKRTREESELKSIEEEMERMESPEGDKYESKKSTEIIKKLELSKRKIFKDK